MPATAFPLEEYSGRVFMGAPTHHTGIKRPISLGDNLLQKHCSKIDAIN